MTGIGHIAQTTGAGALSVRSAHVRVEKPANTSDLGEQRMDDPRHGSEQRSGFAPRQVSQIETGERAPLWYGPRLRPAFVAQVLGQVMRPHAARDPRSVFAAYEEGAARGPARRHIERKI